MNNRFEGLQYLTLSYITGMYKLVGNIHDSEDKDLRYDSLGLSCARHNEGDQLKLMVLSLPLHPRIGLGCCHKEISPRARNSKIFCRSQSRLTTFQTTMQEKCTLKITSIQLYFNLRSFNETLTGLKRM